MRQNDPTRLDSRVLDGHTDAGSNESMRVTSTHRINRNSTQTIVVREEEKEPDIVDMILGGLMGEFKEDPDFAMIGVDLGVSLVPILDQASDIRDILAHLYYMIFDGQHSSFMRWVALAFTLIGLFPVVGSIIKSASKFVIKGVKEALEYLGDILSLFKNVLPEGSDISKLDAYISSNWNRFVEYAMSAWKSTITKLSGAAKLIRAVSSSIADTIVTIENYSKTMLPRAFEWIKAKWDEILSKGKQKAPRQAEERAEQLERLSRGIPERPLVKEDLGVKGEIKELKGTFKLEEGKATVRIDMIEGVIDNPLQIINNLKNLARSNGASTLRIEALLANERLWDLLVRRYGLKTGGGIDFIEIPL